MIAHTTPTQDCIIEAGTMLSGIDTSGMMQSRHDVAIRIHKGVIAQIGPLKGLLGGNEHLPRYGGSNFIAMPGLVNSHHHFGITPLMAGVPFEPLEFWLPQFRAMRSVGPRLDTLFAAIEMLESGTTTVHHIASGLIGGRSLWDQSADDVIAAYGEAGMRAGYSAMLRDQNILSYDGDEAILAAMPEQARGWFAPRLHPAGGSIAAYLDFHSDLHRRHADNPLLRVNYAPANLHWCSDALLEAVGSAAQSAGAQLHMHLVETARQAQYARARFGTSAVRHLHAIGFLGDHVTFGHGNWLEPGDAEILADCGCAICHNASSGLRLGSGRADVNGLRAAGVRLALGIDQSNIADDRDMLLEAKVAWAQHRGTELFNRRVSAAEILQAATEHGAMSAGFAGQTGKIICGMQADIVLMHRDRVTRPYCAPATPLEDVLLHRGHKGAIDKVFVAGRMVVDGGKVTLFDRERVLAQIFEKLSAPPTAAEQEAADMVALAMPTIREHYKKFA